MDKPIEVNPSPVRDQAGSFARDIMLVVSVVPALIAVLGRRDVTEIVTYIASADFAPALGVLLGSGVILWRQLIARKRKATLVTVADAAPNSTAVVKKINDEKELG